MHLRDYFLLLSHMMSSSSSSSKVLFPTQGLRELAVTPTTLRTYDKNLQHFLSHTRLSSTNFLALSHAQLDVLLAQYIESLFQRGCPFDYASHALHGVMFRRPELRGAGFLPTARQTLRGWSRSKRSTSHPPLTWEITVLFAVTLSRSGHHGAAVAMLLAFDCYLRVGELLRLRFCDIVLPHDARMGSSHQTMAVRLPKTKTGLNQWVSVRNTDVAQILQAWMKRSHTDLTSCSSSIDLVFPFPPSHFRKLLHSVKEVLGMSSTAYVPHSLRHGGATRDFLQGDSIEQVMFRGRWAVMASARRYIQMGPALLAAQHVPQQVNHLGTLFARSLVTVLTHTMATVLPAAPTRSTRTRVRFANDVQ